MSWFLLLVLGTAQANDRARELFQNGRDLYDQGRYEAAITAWSEAYELDARPVLLFNLANAYERAGKIEEAYEALLGYRPYAPTEEGELLDARIRAMEARVDEIRDERRKLEDERREAERKLEEERRKAELARQEAEAANQKSNVPVLPIAVTALGAGALGFGAINGVRAVGARKTLAEPAVCTDGMLCTAEAADAIDRQKRAAALADVGLISGAALAGLGVVLFTLPDREASDLQVVPRFDRPGLEVSGAF